MTVKVSWFVTFTVVLTIFANGTIADIELNGPHICKRKENYTTPTVVTRMETYLQIVRNKNFVGRWLRLRAPTEVKFREVDKTEWQQKERVIWECCPGYGEAGIRCVPKCTQCKNGKCIAPETCKCYAGYGGSTCEMKCPAGMRGENCTHACECQNNGICNLSSGRCKCARGFTGDKCELECSNGKYGLNCAETCLCQNGAKCDHITGECVCVAGFLGRTCAIRIEDDKPGKEEENQNDIECRSCTGICPCRFGYDWYKPMSSQTADQNNGHFVVIIGIIVTLLLICVIVFIWLRRCTHTQNLQTKVNHALYMVNLESRSDQYAVPLPPKVPRRTTSLTTGASSVGCNDDSEENFYIDIDRFLPISEESYDHLDHNAARTSVMPHYDRMVSLE